jgi:hypothetical protein
MGFEVLRAVLMRTEGFWRVNTLTFGVTVTTRHGVDKPKDVECPVLLRTVIKFMKQTNKVDTEQFSWYNDWPTGWTTES